MNLHFCHVCQEIRDTAEGFCVLCHTFLSAPPPAPSPRRTVTCAGCGRPVAAMMIGGTVCTAACGWCGSRYVAEEHHA